MKQNKKTKLSNDNELKLIKAENVALRNKNKLLTRQLAKLHSVIDMLIVDWRKADAELADACWETTKKATAILEKIDIKAKP